MSGLSESLSKFFKHPLDFLKEAVNTETGETEYVERVEELCRSELFAGTLEATPDAVAAWAIANGIEAADAIEFAQDVIDDFLGIRTPSEDSMSEVVKSGETPTPEDNSAKTIEMLKSHVASAEEAAVRCIELVEALGAKVESLLSTVGEMQKSATAVTVEPAAPAAEPAPAAEVKPEPDAEVKAQLEKLKAQVAELEAQPVGVKSSTTLSVQEKPPQAQQSSASHELNIQRMLKASPEEISVEDVYLYETKGQLTPRAQAYLESVALAKV